MSATKLRLESHLRKYMSTNGKPTYMLMTRKYERQLFLDEVVQKRDCIDEEITIDKVTIPVLIVDYILMAHVKVDDTYQFVK